MVLQTTLPLTDQLYIFSSIGLEGGQRVANGQFAIKVIKVVHIHVVVQTVQRSEVFSAVYGTVHHKEPLKPFDKE